MTTKTFLALVALTLTSSAVLAKGPDEELYQARVSMLYFDGDFIVSEPLEAIPARKRLMIRNVNYRFSLPAWQTGNCQLNLNGGVDAFFITAPTSWVYQPIFGNVLGNGNMQSEHYLEEGDLEIACFRSATTGQGSASVTVTGFLVDAQ